MLLVRRIIGRAPYSKWRTIWKSGVLFQKWSQGSISPSIYGKVLKFDALADMEPLHIEKSSDLPNERPIFILKLHFNSNLEPSYSFWRWNRTSPKISPKSHKITIL